MSLLLALACGSTPHPPAPPAAGGATVQAPSVQTPTVPKDSDVDGLAAALASPAFASGDAVLIDVRTPEEFAAGHVPGARNVPIDALPARLAELDKADETWVVCEVGGRSARAAALLASEGYRAVNVTGGTKAWREAGKPVE